MKRRRSVFDCEIKKGKEVDEQSPLLCSFIKNVPEVILVEIFLRLSIKEIIMCKSVCKIWYHLIRMPQFAKLHFDHAQPCIAVKGSRVSQVNRFLYLIEPHKVNVTSCHCGFWLCKHRVSLKLDTVMKIPLRNIELLPEANNSKTKGSGATRKRCTKVKPTPHKFCIVNSCKGFLCLSEPQSNNPMTVCNPVTGEYLNLPGTEKSDAKMENIVCGFGYSPKLNKYKVIRMFELGEWQDDSRHIKTDPDRVSPTIAETYTFGKGSWERIGNVPVSRHIKFLPDLFPVYCNGAVNWLLYNNLDQTAFICSFDLDKDSFKSIELPLACSKSECGERLGEIDGCLCFLFFSELSKSFTIWVMNKDGSPSAWTKMITVHDDYCDRKPMPVISYLPISYSKDAGLIMCTALDNVFVHLNQTHDWKYLKICGVDSHYLAYLYVPTLLSLKDALTDEDEILNVNTTDIKWPGQSRALFLSEQNWNFETATKCSDSSDEDSI